MNSWISANVMGLGRAVAPAVGAAESPECPAEAEAVAGTAYPASCEAGFGLSDTSNRTDDPVK